MSGNVFYFWTMVGGDVDIPGDTAPAITDRSEI